MRLVELASLAGHGYGTRQNTGLDFAVNRLHPKQPATSPLNKNPLFYKHFILKDYRNQLAIKAIIIYPARLP
jgi:hypothetical protein